MGKTKIEWTDYSWNPWWGCVKVSPACKNCYAETWDARFDGDHWGADKERRFFGDKHWNEPLKWQKDITVTGMDKVFCASMADVFEIHKNAKINAQLNTQRFKLWELIKRTPNLQWQLLTKRPENIYYTVPGEWIEKGFPNNVWLGVTMESQEYTKRIEKLIEFRTLVKILFISSEPLLSKVTLRPELLKKLDWVITGGESGSNARTPNYDWFEHLRLQCVTAGVPFFFKQWGEYKDLGGEHNRYVRNGKKINGNELNNTHYIQFPKLYEANKSVTV